jgi:hypothetical protein
MQLINISAAEMILYRLQALGVEFIFINSGTDYPPMVEAYSRLKAKGVWFLNLLFARMKTPRLAWPMDTIWQPVKCKL